jgi:hypothetical protein
MEAVSTSNPRIGSSGIVEMEENGCGCLDEYRQNCRGKG